MLKRIAALVAAMLVSTLLVVVPATAAHATCGSTDYGVATTSTAWDRQLNLAYQYSPRLQVSTMGTCRDVNVWNVRALINGHYCANLRVRLSYDGDVWEADGRPFLWTCSVTSLRVIRENVQNGWYYRIESWYWQSVVVVNVKT